MGSISERKNFCGWVHIRIILLYKLDDGNLELEANQGLVCIPIS